MTAGQAAPLIAVLNSSEEIVAMLCLALEDAGYSAVGASIAEFNFELREIAAFLERHDPRVVIFDVGPPYAANFALFRELRATQAGDRRAILTTTDVRSLDEFVGGTNAIEVFRKPFELDDLLAAVRRVLAGASAAEEDVIPS